MMESAEFCRQIEQRGYVVVPEALSAARVARLNAEIEPAIDHCAGLRRRYGVEDGSQGIAHHVLGLGGAFLELLDALPLQPQIEAFLGGKIIVNSFGAFRHDPGVNTYAGGIHRDIRSFFGATPMMLNMLVMLDTFTAQNGATLLLPGSHRAPTPPSREDFDAGAERATGATGSVLVFHSQLWHASGENTSAAQRRALTLTFTRPFYKQQIDYPRLVGYERADELSEKQRQLVGFNARVPASYEEWYQPQDKRMYKPGQG